MLGGLSLILLQEVLFDSVNLTTLNLLTWPVGYQSAQPPMFYAAMQPQLARLATDMLKSGRHELSNPRRRHTRRLKVVVFGIRERSEDFAVPLPRYFV